MFLHCAYIVLYSFVANTKIDERSHKTLINEKLTPFYLRLKNVKKYNLIPHRKYTSNHT